MAGEQGTGKHPHKSAAEPYEHHEGKTTKGSESKSESKSGTESKAESKSNGAKSSSKSESHSGEQGTGKHPHKKASDPKEHHEGAKK